MESIPAAYGWRQGTPLNEPVSSSQWCWEPKVPCASNWRVSTLQKTKAGAGSILTEQLPNFVCSRTWTENPLFHSPVPYRLTHHFYFYFYYLTYLLYFRYILCKKSWNWGLFNYWKLHSFDKEIYLWFVQFDLFLISLSDSVLKHVTPKCCIQHSVRIFVLFPQYIFYWCKHVSIHVCT